MYNLEKHRFVAYTTNSIKNNTVQSYAYLKNMCYSTDILKMKTTLKKIFNHINLLHYNKVEYTQKIQC